MKNRLAIRVFIAIFLTSTIIPSFAWAGNFDNGSGPRDLRFDLMRDSIITAATSAAFLGLGVFEKQLAPDNCRWCGVNSFDAWGHDNLKWSNTGAADTTSSVFGFGLAPMVAYGVDAIAAQDAGGLGGYYIDALVITEAVSSAALFTEGIKLAVGRQRPSAHYAEAGTSTSSDDNLSFFSFHTSVAFALAVSSGTVASMRGYRLAPVVWGTGLAVAAATGYFRVAADKHYLTDVIAGAVIGSAFGFGMPYLLHRPSKSGELLSMFSAVPMDGGVFVNFRKPL